MEMRREMFFDGKDLKTGDVVQAIVSNPTYWVEILNYIWDVMRADENFEHEKRDLKEKYEHEMKELCEKYWHDLDD